ncbi:MAG: UbiA family prenyltransferase [Saprospiraceae bacterium]
MNGEIINRISLFLRLIRIDNLLFLSYLQFSIYWLVYKQQISGISHSGNLNDIFPIWIFPTFFIMALGNLINDFFDFKGDIINNKRPSGKGEISKKEILTLVYILSGLVITSIVISQNYIPRAFEIYGIISICIFAYSKWLKCIPLLGNLLIALLCSIAVLFPIMFTYEIYSSSLQPFIAGFIYFVFIITLIREIVKDLEDMKGDKATHCKTLPIRIGEKTTKIIALIITVSSLIMATFWATFFEMPLVVSIFILTVLPLIYVSFQFSQSNNFFEISRTLKMIMLSSSLLIFIFHYSS